MKRMKLCENLSVVMALTMMSVSLMACGTKTEAPMEDIPAEECELGDYPSNEFESRVGRTEFESYDEIIGMLEGDEAYALVDVKGADEPVLLVAEWAYDNLDGNFATTEATPYTKKSNGKVTSDSAMVTGGTANPIAIDDEGILYCATHHTMGKYCYGTNGTDDTAVMAMEYIYVEEFDDNGDPKTVGGFYRTENTVIDNDGTSLEPGDVDKFWELYNEYNNTHVVGFTLVEQ